MRQWGPRAVVSIVLRRVDRKRPRGLDFYIPRSPTSIPHSAFACHHSFSTLKPAFIIQSISDDLLDMFPFL